MIPANLFVIVVVQGIVCMAVRSIVRTPDHRTLRHWLAAIAFGVVLGLAMDKALGAFALFGYLPSGAAGPVVDPRALSLATLLFNGAFSYGLAVATAGVLAGIAPRTNLPSRSTWMSLCAAAVAVGGIGILLLPDGTFPMMFAWGSAVVGLGELVFITAGLVGPIVACLSGVDWRPLATLWAFSVAVGAAYEAVNWIAPFWVWLPQASHARALMSLMMIVLGYLVLFHPIVVYWTLLQPRLARPDIVRTGD